MASRNQPARVAEEPTGMEPARLVSIGGSVPREYLLGRGATAVGSASDNDLIVAETTVSRHHARLHHRRGRFRVVDLESTNGTFVNGRRVRGSAALRRGDEVRFGAARFALMVGARDAAAVTRGTILGRIGPGTAAGFLVLLFLVAFQITRYEFAAPHPTPPRAKRAPEAAPSAAPATAARGAPAAAAPSVAVKPAAAAAPVPVEPAEAPPPGPQPAWLATLNRYRVMARLKPVTRDTKLDRGDHEHVSYLFQNYAATIRAGSMPGVEMHLETPGNPWYTAEGAAAGKASDVDFVWWKGPTPAGVENFAIIDWIGGAFHRLPLLSPRLRQVGYAVRCEEHLCIAALNAQSDLDPPNPAGGLYDAPIEFPPAGAQIDLRTFSQEWPDPLASCAGYRPPTGLPITLQLGAFDPVTLQSFGFERIDTAGAATKLDACGFDLSNYKNPQLASQTTAREVLKSHGTVVVIPRRPLDKGATYRVSMTANGKPYQWTFSVEP
jgi:hypothetical protein